MKIFMTQSWKKNSEYQWKDQDSFKVMEMMTMGYILHQPPFLFLLNLLLLRSFLFWDEVKANGIFYLFLIFGVFNEWNQG